MKWINRTTPTYWFLQIWDEEEDEPDAKGIRVFKVSENTEAFLKNVFVANQTMRQWFEEIWGSQHSHYSLPLNGQVVKG